MDEMELIKELPVGLLFWYDFKKESRILYIGDASCGTARYLRSIASHFTCVDWKSEDDFTETLKESSFDYIVAVGIIEKMADPVFLLQKLKSCLSEKGKLLIGAYNRLGLPYFCGEKDPFTKRNFDGIENYRRATDNVKNGRAYSKAQWCAFLQKAELPHQFFSVLPNLSLPQLIYHEGYLPKEELSGRYFPKYDTPHTVFLEEEFLYADVIENGLFHTLANAFFIECGNMDDSSTVRHATLSMDRGKEKAMATVIYSDNTVEKRAIYKEGLPRIHHLATNTMELQKRGLPMVFGEQKGNAYTMPYVKGVSLVKHLRELIFSDKEKFIEEMDGLRELILQTSDIISETELGSILEKGYVDFIPLNAVQTENGAVFFDQEMYYENYPLNAILYRAIHSVYINDQKMEQVLPMSFFFKRYKMDTQLEAYQTYDADFIAELRNKKELSPFYKKFERNANMLHTNRQKINYSAIEYQKIFIDIFRDIDHQKIILFGSGNFTSRFLSLYGKQYDVFRIVDNNEKKWGEVLFDVPIVSPAILSELNKNEYRLIICIKNYGAIVEQLKEQGIENYCIYDPNISYQTKKIENRSVVQNESTQKKYNKGYVAGVFDLFHIGHLNLLRRAKAECHYLIVGVVTDEGVAKYKKTETVISFAERLEIVSACKYVDEAVEIPLAHGGSEDAYNLYRFDCQFSGSDYTNDPKWLSEKEFLNAQGVDLVFFPYTEGTSSTKLKAFLNANLG